MYDIMITFNYINYTFHEGISGFKTSDFMKKFPSVHQQRIAGLAAKFTILFLNSRNTSQDKMLDNYGSALKRSPS